MPEPATEALHAKLEAIRARYPSCDPQAVAEVVCAVLATMAGDLTAHEARLLAEVEELGRAVARARHDIAALRMNEITARHIPAASDELDAVAAHTASATESILEACEELDRLAGALECQGMREATRALAARTLRQATMRVYEACSFHDITGQRIAKVVAALQVIDGKVGCILRAFANHRRVPELVRATLIASATGAAAGPVHLGPPGAARLSGPQRPAAAMGQDAVDRLLADLA